MPDRSMVKADAIAETEKDFMRAIHLLAELCGWLIYHTHDSRRSPAGFPDLVLVKPPRVLFIETKSEKGRVTPEQQTWLTALEACDEPPQTYLARPSDWESIAAVIQGRTWKA